LAIFIANLLFGIISGLLAHHKARNALGWFAAGCLVGPFALLVVLLPMAVKEGVTRKCPGCLETVRTEARICRYCQSELEKLKVA
jgi:hypothetical protein